MRSTGKQRVINRSVAQIDPYRIELITDYLLDGESRASRQRFRTDMYLFVPIQSGINPENYPINKFYQDVSLRLRIREPNVGFRALFAAEDSMLRRLMMTVETATQNPSRFDAQAFADEIKFVGCSFVTFFVKRIARAKIRAALSIQMLSGLNQDEKEKLVGRPFRHIWRAYKILHSWRQLIYGTVLTKLQVNEQLRLDIQAVDEYCSFRFRDGLAELSQILAMLGQSLEPTRFTWWQRRLRAHIRLEHFHCQKRGLLWIDDRSSPYDLERFMMRRGQVKKNVQQVLYLDMRSQPLFTLRQQVGAMLAAAMAGMWALFAQMLILRHSQADLNTENMLSTGTFVLFTALTLAYVLKDRIKEVGRHRLKKGLLSSLPDTHESIRMRTSQGDNVEVGALQESAKFIPWRSIPEDAQNALRGKFKDPGLQDVVFYRKQVQFHYSKLKKVREPVTAIHDILRLDLRRFCKNLDVPQRSAHFLRLNGDAASLAIPKVYHLEILFIFSTLQNRRHRPIHKDLLRIVITQDGIVRMEEVKKHRNKPIRGRPLEVKLSDIIKAS